MKHILILIGVLLVTSFSAQARQFDGKWTGSGSVSDPRTGSSSPCERVEISITRTDEMFYVSRLQFECGLDGRWKWKPTRFDIRGGGLYLNGTKVGRIDANTAAVDLSPSDEDVTWKAWFEFRGATLIYIETLESTEVSVELAASLNNSVISKRLALQLNRGAVRRLGSSADQRPVLEQVEKFLGFSGPRLYVGRDREGECRIFIYPQNDEFASRLWFEGTFQLSGGPVSGLTVPFMLSSAVAESQIDKLDVTSQVLMVSTQYPGRAEGVSAMRLERTDAGALKAISYATPSAKRSCEGLRRVL